MSETIVEEDLVVEEEAELDVEKPPVKPPRKKEKNPNRVKQGFKLAGQHSKVNKQKKKR